MRVKAVSAYVPLEVKHLNRQQYKELGDGLVEALGDRIHVFYDYPLEKCWLYEYLRLTDSLDLPPATEIPSDRYAGPKQMVCSNIVQHNRTNWAMAASLIHPDVDCWVWLDYGVLKQGDFTGKRVTQQHVADFIKKLEDMPELLHIPFPGIWDKGVPSDTGANWRFVGSTHIWPTQFLPRIDKVYRRECIKFVERTRTVPIDLPVWAYTELEGGLPFLKYDANHDHTQFTNLP